MTSFLCERCRYVHSSGNRHAAMLKRCPVCGSSRIKIASGIVKSNDSSIQISNLIRRIESLQFLPLNEQNEERENLHRIGIHIVTVDQRRGNLSQTLSIEDARKYLVMILQEGAGFGMIGRSILAVEKKSPLRSVVGKIAQKIDELKKVASTDQV